jgi:hypothetical protein
MSELVMNATKTCIKLRTNLFTRYNSQRRQDSYRLDESMYQARDEFTYIL